MSLLFVLFCGSASCLADLPSKSKDFALHAEVLTALEDGPLVIKVTLSYHGARPLDIYSDPSTSDVRLEHPSEWEGRIRSSSYDGPAAAVNRLLPGCEQSVLLKVHRNYTNIRAGKKSLVIHWDIYAPSKDGTRPGELIAPLAVHQDVDIQTATPQRLAALRECMEQQLRDPDMPSLTRYELVQDILDTRHQSLAPLAWRIIEAPKTPALTYELIAFIYECPAYSSVLDGRLAKLAADSRWDGRWDLFDFWRNRKAALSPAAWRTLNDANSVWTRALTYVVFAKRCNLAWKDSLLRDLRDQSTPVAGCVLNGLVSDLDADDFDRRERASARLVRLGERAEAGLRRALDGPLSAEARRRAEEAVGQIATAKQPPECLQALEYFVAHDAPENGELLQVLAEGEPDAWLTQEAKAKLARWRKARGSSDK